MPGGEQVFLYGNNVLKIHVARMTEEVPRHAGFYSLNDISLGFGCWIDRGELETQPHSIIVFHQFDIGEYIRSVECPHYED